MTKKNETAVPARKKVVRAVSTTVKRAVTKASPDKTVAADKLSPVKTSVAKKVLVKKAPVSKKVVAAKKAPVVKKAPTAKKPAADKASVVKKDMAADAERREPETDIAAALARLVHANYRNAQGTMPAPFNPLDWQLAEPGPAGELVPPLNGVEQKWILYPDYVEAFRKEAMTGIAVSQIANKFHMSRWDRLFALGFTNYRDIKAYAKKFEDRPMESDREILVRLYYANPGFPTLIQSPPITELVRYLFNIQSESGDGALKRCIPHLAVLLGKDRVTGYRWARSKDGPADGKGSSLSTQKVSAKVFSMKPEVARDTFWLIALQVMRSRNMRTDRLRSVLADYNVRLPE